MKNLKTEQSFFLVKGKFVGTCHFKIYSQTEITPNFLKIKMAEPIYVPLYHFEHNQREEIDKTISYHFFDWCALIQN